MKRLLLFSLRRLFVATFMAFAVICYASAEAEQWTTSYFERAMANSVDDVVPTVMAPMKIIAKYQDGYIWFAIRTYYDAILPCAVQVNYMYGAGYGSVYSTKTAIYHALREVVDTDRYAILEGTGGNWIKMSPTTSEQMEYYSVTLVSVSLKVLDENYKDFFYNAAFLYDSSVREAFETCSLVAPDGNLNLICTVYS